MLKYWYQSSTDKTKSSSADVAIKCPGKKYDAIVVGAGPAGASAAYFMARESLDVLLLERGCYPGAKVCGGSSLVSEHIHALFPNFWNELECERLISHQSYWLMTDDSIVKLGFQSLRLAAAPFNRFSVRRVNLYDWLVRKAQSAGANVQFCHHADQVIFNSGQAVGVHISPPQDTIFTGNVILLADGANSMLGEKAGLRPRISAQDAALYAKETIALPGRVLEERFNLPAGHGAVIGLVGYPTAGFNGTASIHTFRNSLNINVGMSVADMAKSGYTPHQLIERLKNHNLIKPLIEGGVTTEYGAAIIPEGGYHAIPELVHPGLMFIGDSASLVNGVLGFSLAMWSGYFAAQAAITAKRTQDFSPKTLNLYRTLLKESFVLQDLRANAPQAQWMRDNPSFFDLYTRFANESAYYISKVYTMPKKEKRRFIFKKLTSLQPVSKIAQDAWRLLKVIR